MQSKSNIGSVQSVQRAAPQGSSYTMLMHALQQIEIAAASDGPKRLWGCRQLTITLFPNTESACFRVEGDVTTKARVLSMLKTPSTAFCISPFGASAADIDNAIALSFKEFKWVLAMNFSQGRLLPTISGDVSYSLPSWPNFGALGRSPSHLRICALLSERASTLQQIIDRCNVEHDEVCSLLNGASLVGSLSVHRSPTLASNKSLAPVNVRPAATAVRSTHRSAVLSASSSASLPSRTSVLGDWFARLRKSNLLFAKSKLVGN